MSDMEETAALRAEWDALFDRLLAHGERLGANKALANVFASARAQMDGITSEAAPAAPHAVSAKPKRTSRSKPAQRAVRGKRAPSGSIQRDVRTILEKSLVPLRVQQVIEEAARSGRGALKDTSVRMALQTMRKNGEIRQNDIGEWSLTPQSARSDAEMPSGHDEYVTREAA